MVKLKRLKILKYRNVRPGTELRFDDGVNLVLGQNASGKTTLLALISAVCREDFSQLRDEEYELEAETTTGPHGSAKILKLSHRRRPIDDNAGDQEGPRRWDDQRELIRIPATTSPKPRPAPSWAGPGLPDLLASVDCLDAYRFDESLGVFAAITGRVPEIGHVGVPPRASAQLHMHDEGDAQRDAIFVPPEIRTKLWSSRARDPIFSRPLASSDLELCRQIAGACGFRDITVMPNFGERRIIGNDVLEFSVEGFTFEVTRTDGTIIHHDRLSYGQKRLLAFFYYLACNPHIVIADELVNGLHHRWIETCMNALGDRQAFLTSQNPLLFDHVDFDSVEQVRSRFITCRSKQVDGREQMVWQNMAEDDARRFFDAYQADIEYIGDILITRGMW